jgi:hypothetical protein
VDAKHLVSVEKWTLILAALAIGVAVVALDRSHAFGVSVGAGLMALNAWVLRRIGQRAFRTFKRPGAAILLFNAKMFVLIALVWAVIRYLHVDPVSFVVGISVFPLAVVIVAIRNMVAPSQADDPHDTPNGETHG